MAAQTIPKGAPLPAGGRLLNGTLDSGSNCASSRCTVEVDMPPVPASTAAVPPPPAQTNPLIPPETSVVPPPTPVPVPSFQGGVPDVETGYFTQCSLGMCGPVSSAGQVAMFGDGKTATIQAVPADAFWARRAFAVANGDRRSLTEQNQDWDNSGVRTMMSDPNLVAYAEQLRPIFGDEAYAVARSNMMNANGLGGTYNNSGYAAPDATARSNTAGALQTSGLTSGDTSLAELAFSVDPAAFNNAVIGEAPNGQPVMFTSDGLGGFRQVDGFRGENVNDTITSLHGGVPAYMKRVEGAERGAGEVRKQIMAGDSKLAVAKETARGRVAAANARANSARGRTSSAVMGLNERIKLIEAQGKQRQQDREAQHKRNLELNRQRAALKIGAPDPTLAPPVLKAY